jgi:cytochrome c553
MYGVSSRLVLAALLGLLSTTGAVVQRAAPDSAAATSTRELMSGTIYPASDAVFYIETRTPASDDEWRALESKTRALVEAANVLVAPGHALAEERWTADARLLISASVAAQTAAQKRDVAALAALNDALYAACVTCHNDYKPGYGRRSSTLPTADGYPDLQGIWNFATLTPLERPRELAGKEFLSDAEAKAFVQQTIQRNDRDRRDGGAAADVGRAVNDYWFDRGTALARIDGKIRSSIITDPRDGEVPPLTEAASARAAARTADARAHQADGPENRSLQERCLTFNAGPPILPGPYNNYIQIIQAGDHVVVYSEMIHEARVVALDGRPHAPPPLRFWQGDPRGRWEGNTLIVDSTNFTDKTNVRGSGADLHLVERFTRTNPDTLLYEFTIDDPASFARPWSGALPMRRTTDRLFEYACHEGNYALEDILRGARAQEPR